MPVTIRCPNCGATVVVRVGGVVKMHFEAGDTGDLCSFTQTASSMNNKTPAPHGMSSEEIAARLDFLRAERARKSEAQRERMVQCRLEALAALSDEELAELSKREAEERERRNAAHRRKVLEAQAANRKSYCSVCGLHMKFEGPKLRAHRHATTGRWCSGGHAPTAAQKATAKGKKKGSVWTVSGGLPTHGRRR